MTRDKLRYRDGGRQRVRILRDGAQAAELTEELELLHSGVRLKRKVSSLRQRCRMQLKMHKRVLALAIEQTGFHLHGLAIRQRRAQSVEQEVQK